MQAKPIKTQERTEDFTRWQIVTILRKKKTKTPHYLTFSQNLSYFIFQTFSRSGKLVRQFQDVFKNPRLPSIGKSGCISWNPDYGFAIERVKRISLPRNPSSKWISIMKSKSGYFAFLSLPLVWEIRKNGFAKLSREQWSFFCCNYDCALETVVQVEIRFQIKQSIENPKPGFQNLNPDFQIESSQL